jgi:hypothetical protein
MSFPKLSKDPDAVLDYQCDWTEWLAGASDTITGSVWLIAPEGGIVESEDHASSYTTTTATIWLAGGTLGRKYRITNRITTAAGRVNDKSFDVLVQSN